MSRMWDRQLVLNKVQHWPFVQPRTIHGQSKEQKSYKMQSHFLLENDTIDALNMLENFWYARHPTLTVKMSILICFWCKEFTRNCRCFKLLVRMSALWHIIQRPCGFMYSHGSMAPDNCLERLRANFCAFTLKCCAYFFLNGGNYTLIFCSIMQSPRPDKANNTTRTDLGAGVPLYLPMMEITMGMHWSFIQGELKRRRVHCHL